LHYISFSYGNYWDCKYDTHLEFFLFTLKIELLASFGNSRHIIRFISIKIEVATSSLSGLDSLNLIAFILEQL
jgi:hypothetical protein